MMRPFMLSTGVSLLLLAPALVGAHVQGDEKVTTASLPVMLKGLGYEPTKNGETSQQLTIERAKFTFRINLSVSGNEKKLWMSSYLIEIADLSKVPATALSDALISNADTGPAHFYLTKVGEKYWLKMAYALDNHNISPAYLRAELDWFMDQMASTSAVWEKAKWVKG